MAGINLMTSGFNAGEWSPLLDGRVDLQKYSYACNRLENFVIDSRGATLLRPGFRYIAGTKSNSGTSRLIPFEFSITQAYILEFGNNYIRFYKDQDQIDSGGSPYEVATTYSAAEVQELGFCQSADVLYLFHKSHPPRKLSRTGHTSWTLSTINFRPPAISEQGIKPAATLTLAATTGTGVTFTAGSAVFLSGDVGRVITSGAGRAAIVSFTSTSIVSCDIIDDFASTGPIASQSWSLLGSPNGNVAPSAKEPVGAVITLTCSGGSESRTALLGLGTDYWTASGSGTDEYYLINTAPGYTASKPSGMYIDNVASTEGIISSLGILQWAWGDADTLGYDTIYIRLADGTDPDTKSTVLSPDRDFVQRTTATATNSVFRSSDVGKYVRIHSGLIKITSYSSATVVSGEILKALVDNVATVNWTIESDAWSATNGYPSVGTFFQERLILAGSTAFPETIWGSVVGDYENFTPGVDDSDSIEFTLGGRQVQYIRWIEPGKYLTIGTLSGEWRVGSDDSGTPLTPTNILARQEQSYGSDDVPPVAAGGSTLFVQRLGRKVREFTYQWEQNGYVAPDLTVLAEHVTESGIAGMVFQPEPNGILWAWRTDGELIGMTYLRDQDVIGWHRHPVDNGAIESMAVIPGDGYSEVWAIVNRTVNGSTVRYVELLESFFTDTAATYTTNKGLNARFLDSMITYSGASTTTITGLTHLNGETVAILADGYYAGTKTVASGQITLTSAATVVHVGLPYTGTLQTMRPNAGLRSGSSQGKTVKIHGVTIRVYNSGNFKMGRDSSNLDVCYDPERSLTLGRAYPLFTGDITRQFDGRFDSEARITLVQDIPLPLTIVALMPEVSFN